MAVSKSLEGSQLVWQRVNNFFRTKDASPLQTQAFLRELKRWLSTQKGNPRLQYVSFSNVTTSAVTVPEVSQNGCTLYAIYAKKQNTATAAYFKINDHATTAGGANGANVKFTLPLLVGNDEIGLVFQPGVVFSTGIAVASETTAAGGANSTSGDGPNGFIILG